MPRIFFSAFFIALVSPHSLTEFLFSVTFDRPYSHPIVVTNSLHIRMERAGISTQRYNLPVVDVSGQIDVRPTTETIVSLLKG